MSPEAQRIAIAEACGWTVNPDPKDHSGHRYSAPKWTSPPLGRHALPDYLNDLNAMHEAEVRSGKIIGPAEWATYCDRLRWVITQWIARAGGPGSICGIVILELAVKATAAQRAEAFLRTIGKWQDTARKEAKP